MTENNVPAGDRIKVQLADGSVTSLNEFLSKEGLTGDDADLQSALQKYVTSKVGNEQLTEIDKNYGDLFSKDAESSNPAGNDLLLKAGKLGGLFGSYNKAANTLTIDIGKHESESPDSPKIKTLKIVETITHELSHALDDNMLESAGNQEGSPAFVKANWETECRAKIREIKMEIELTPQLTNVQTCSPFAAQYKADKEKYKNEGTADDAQAEAKADQQFRWYLLSAPEDQLPAGIKKNVLNWREIYSKQGGSTGSDLPPYPQTSAQSPTQGRSSVETTNQEGDDNILMKILRAIIMFFNTIFGGGKQNVSDTLGDAQKKTDVSSQPKDKGGR